MALLRVPPGRRVHGAGAALLQRRRVRGREGVLRFGLRDLLEPTSEREREFERGVLRQWLLAPWAPRRVLC